MTTPLSLPPPWTNPALTLYHGTLAQHVLPILRGIDLRRVRTRSDFGPGFYTTTSEAQAERWAREVARRSNHSGIAVIRFDVSREDLAELRCLWFVRGDADAEDFWNLIRHCRAGYGSHGTAVPGGGYDVVAPRLAELGGAACTPIQ